jgi:hypothetical protein
MNVLPIRRPIQGAYDGRSQKTAFLKVTNTRPLSAQQKDLGLESAFVFRETFTRNRFRTDKYFTSYILEEHRDASSLQANCRPFCPLLTKFVTV